MTTLGSISSKQAVRVVTPDWTIRSAAELMREQHVGALVVVDRPGRDARPIGIVTDRDIVVAIVALDLDARVFLIDDLLGRRLVTARTSQTLREGVRLMKAKGVRRLPLVNAEGALAGIVTLDDLLSELSKDLACLAEVTEREIKSEFALRPGRIRSRQGPRAKASKT